MTPFDTPAAAAAHYAARGWPVLPIHTPTATGCSCGTADCSSPGKHPRINRGVHLASIDGRQIAAWWKRWPTANVGIATGSIVVLDVDGEDGARSLDELQSRHATLAATASVDTARGRHLYFRAGDATIRNSVGRIGRGLDVRGRGGYAVAPPSRHASGDRYRWTDLDAELAPLPSWLARLNAPPKPTARPADVATHLLDRYVAAAVQSELDRIATSPPRTRNDTVNRAAFRLGQLAGAGLVLVEALEAPLYEAARAVGQGEREALATIASGLTAGYASPRIIYTRPRQARRS